MNLSGVKKKRSNLRQDAEAFICRFFVLFLHMCVDTLRFWSRSSSRPHKFVIEWVLAQQSFSDIQLFSSFFDRAGKEPYSFCL